MGTIIVVYIASAVALLLGSVAFRTIFKRLPAKGRDAFQAGMPLADSAHDNVIFAMLFSPILAPLIVLLVIASGISLLLFRRG